MERGDDDEDKLTSEGHEYNGMIRISTMAKRIRKFIPKEG